MRTECFTSRRPMHPTIVLRPPGLGFFGQPQRETRRLQPPHDAVMEFLFEEATERRERKMAVSQIEEPAAFLDRLLQVCRSSDEMCLRGSTAR